MTRPQRRRRRRDVVAGRLLCWPLSGTPHASTKATAKRGRVRPLGSMTDLDKAAVLAAVQWPQDKLRPTGPERAFWRRRRSARERWLRRPRARRANNKRGAAPISRSRSGTFNRDGSATPTRSCADVCLGERERYGASSRSSRVRRARRSRLPARAFARFRPRASWGHPTGRRRSWGHD